MKRALAKKESNILPITIRPEVNLEKWFAIWTPAQSRSKPKLRVLEKKKINEDGSFILQKVKINPSLEYGNLTTEDQKTWYALLYLWEKAGKPQVLVFSLRELAKTLKRTWSTKVRNALKESLLRLSISAFTWINSYYDSKAKQTLEILDSFQIISRLAIAREDQNVNSEQCICQFSDPLYQNLLVNYTKPISFDTILSFRSGVAQLIYKYLELVMQDKVYYERKSENLFDDIGLEGEEYKFASARRRILLTAVEELREISFQMGILEISIEETVDGSDWKLVVKRFPVKPGTNRTQKVKEAVKVEEVVKEVIKEALSLKQEVLNYFLERFGLRREATKAELEKAEELIKVHQLDFEKAKQIIDFAKSEAVETNYKPKSFNGIVQYVGEALERYQAKQSKTQINEEIKRCNFCNEDGLLGVIEQSGRRKTMHCPHNGETLKLRAAKWNITFEFWSENPPMFSY